jgi:transcriptional/translational regulatory protein YebC/TACO1
MPKDNIERAIAKAQGGTSGEGRLEEISYEGYGPNNVALIIDCTTDNRNRTVGEVRSVVEKNGGTMAESGAVSWQFSTIGRILLEFETEEEKKERESEKWNKDKSINPSLDKQKTEEFELELYEIDGIKEVEVDEQGIAVYTEPTKLAHISKEIENRGVRITESEFVKISSNEIQLEDQNEIEKIEGFIEKIEELDDVSKVWTNMKY